MWPLPGCHQGRVDRQSHHCFGLTRFANLIGRRARAIKRQLFFLFDIHVP